MDGTPLKKLARDLGLSVERLTTELESLGIGFEPPHRLTRPIQAIAGLANH